MIKEEFIYDMFSYFSRFVGEEVIKKRVVQPDESKQPGYDELIANVINRTDKKVIADLDSYFFSINEKYVSDAIRVSTGYLLFVEYGKCTVMQNNSHLISSEIELSVTVGHEFTIANNDMIEEVLIMQKTLDILNSILDTMNEERKDPNLCPNIEYLSFPCKIIPVEPQLFYDHGGWSAIFTRVDD